MVSFLDRPFPFVKPPPIFRAQLKQALLAEHRRRLASGSAVPVPQRGGISWRWSLAATVPLPIGLLATILWRRSHRSAEQLASLLGGQQLDRTKFHNAPPPNSETELATALHPLPALAETPLP